MAETVQISNSQFFEEVARMLSEGATVTIPTLGSSMLPFIKGGRDKVALRSPQGIRRGDIVLARLEGNRYVLHRIYRLSEDRVTLMGDGNLQAVENCASCCVIGVAVKIIRGGREVDCRSRKERLKAAIWRRLLPLRRYLLAGIRQAWR